MHSGLARALAEAGYANFSVKQVIEPAGVSRRTFYDLFSDKGDAFVSAHEETLAGLTSRVAIETAGGQPWAAGVAAALRAALELGARAPERALLLVGEPLTAGPRAAYAHDQVVARFAPLLRLGRQGASEEAPPALEEALLGGVLGVVASRLRGDALGALPSLAPSLTQFVLTPYLGPAEAKRVAAGPLA